MARCANLVRLSGPTVNEKVECAVSGDFYLFFYVFWVFFLFLSVASPDDAM